MSRINTNVSSILAARIFNQNNTALGTAIERLSTGLRINRGKDDPAGLIASETLRSEITAINASLENVQRADDMVSVAEGALQEVSSLLVELESLVDRTANEAALSSDEIKANQLEIDSILDSINRIANTTEFAGKKLLNGSLDYATSAITTGLNASAISDLQINAARVPRTLTTASGASTAGYRTVVVQVTQSAQTGRVERTASAITADTTIQITGKHGTETLSFASGTTGADIAQAVNLSKTLTGVSAYVSGSTLYFNSTDYGSDAFVTVAAVSGSFAVTGGDSSTGDYGQDAGVTINGVSAVVDGLEAALHTQALDIELTLAEAFAQQTSSSKTFYITANGGADFSISPTLGVSSMASLGMRNVSPGELGKGNIGYLSSLGTGGTNQLTSGNFETAQRIIRAANTQVASFRGRLGAFQKHTLESSRNSLQVALENTSAAESAIRDADFAYETSQLTRYQILVNSSSFALQIANQTPQNVLALLG
jgi:flagellin